ncbi:ATP-dependent 6-phosphofructokinase [Robiginitalea sediminis]|uniref:ATP-dependent 6-phosphofructokinase n=1 Tax=Robiginitalea sediminis TaxID=1982593 RepID=UPI000B4B663F|nr:ATP-dependent 6-phosphofructokinase [Robiginitalea sediminis]
MSENRFEIRHLGEPTHMSPLPLSSESGDKLFNFVDDGQQVLFSTEASEFNRCLRSGEPPLVLQKAGPRQKLYFDPEQTTAAIVTCGGLCPGINNVIRGVVMGLYYFYGVKKIIGIPYGFEGLTRDCPHPYRELTPDSVRDIHQFGGTILGSSRGAQDVGEMVETLQTLGVNMLFTIGGDGTLKGADALGAEIQKRGLDIAVVGIPKTIDNDIDLIDKSFGFETSYGVAATVIRDAHNEATGAYNGIALVKLMGRDSGFIAASAAMAMPEVNFVLVPELPFRLDGDNGLLKLLEHRLKIKKHAVIVVAEGAGQYLFEKGETVKDASGNIKHQDIGVLLKDRIGAHFKALQTEVTIKYIDPSYIIRSAPANASDSIFCNRLAYQAVHGAMAGKTRFLVGLANNQLVYFPIEAVGGRRKKIDLEGEFWFATLQSTGQPYHIG